MIMEDVCDTALSMRSSSREERPERLARLKDAAREIAAFVEAAIALNR